MVVQSKDRHGDKTGEGYVKFDDKKSVDKVFDMGRSHHVSECKLQISRRKISNVANSMKGHRDNDKSEDSGEAKF